MAPYLQPARRVPGRAAAAGLAVFTSLLPPPASARWRIPESAAPRGTAAQARGKLRCVRRGWCIVLYRARRSRLTRFCRGAARGGVAVVLCCLRRVASARYSALPLPECLERALRRVCLCSVKTFCCPGEWVWWGEK